MVKQKEMKILNLLNPSAWLGQILVLGFFVMTGFAAGLYFSPECPPTTSIQVDNKIKAKRGSTATSTIDLVNESQNCKEWLRSLDKSQIRAIRK